MPPKPITAQDLPNMPEIFLGLAALLLLIVGAATQNIVAIVGALAMGMSALATMGFIESPLLKQMFSFLTVSANSGALLFIAWIRAVATPGAAGLWTTWVIFISAMLSLFAAYRAIVLKRY